MDESGYDEGTHALASPEMQDLFTNLAQRIVARVKCATQILGPRRPAKASAPVTDWFNEYEDRFLEISQDAFRAEMPDLFARRQTDIRQFLIENLWPLVKPELVKYAIHHIATQLVARRYSDATVVMQPEPCESGWRLALRIHNQDRELGQVVLDMEGNVIEDQTTTREAFREALRVAA